MHSTLLPRAVPAGNGDYLNTPTAGCLRQPTNRNCLRLLPPSSPVPEPEPTQVDHLPDSAPITQLSGGDHGKLRSQHPPIIPEVPAMGPTHQPTPVPNPNETKDKLSGEPCTSYASPLAMLFQPLIVGEDVTMEDQGHKKVRGRPRICSITDRPLEGGWFRLTTRSHTNGSTSYDIYPEPVVSSRHETAITLFDQVGRRGPALEESGLCSGQPLDFECG